jgi:hypothetical protein
MDYDESSETKSIYFCFYSFFFGCFFFAFQFVFSLKKMDSIYSELLGVVEGWYKWSNCGFVKQRDEKKLFLSGFLS